MIKKGLLVLIILAVFGGHARAAQGHRYLSLAVDYGAFFPSDSTIRSHFGSVWPQFSFGWFEPVKPNKWSITYDLSAFSHTAGGSAFLLPVTFGVERAIGGTGTSTVQPYLALRAGPYYGNVNGGGFGINGHAIGADANASLGVTFQQRYFVELRYDYFSELAHGNFSGLSIFGGVRVIDI